MIVGLLRWSGLAPVPEVLRVWPAGERWRGWRQGVGCFFCEMCHLGGVSTLGEGTFRLKGTDLALGSGQPAFLTSRHAVQAN